MRRRDFITLFGGVAMWPPAAHAQQSAMPVIGFVKFGVVGKPYPPLSAFLRGLEETGFVEGRNVTIEYRSAEGHYERLPAPNIRSGPTQSKRDSCDQHACCSCRQGGEYRHTHCVHDWRRSGTNGSRLQFARPGANATGVSTMNVEVALSDWN